MVYSAGGGANVAAEAVGYLLGQGYAMADLVKHFAVVQHGNNWVTNYGTRPASITRELHHRHLEPELRHLRRRQAPAPTSSTPSRRTTCPTAAGFGAAFAAALAVATGGTALRRAARGLRGSAATLDASDAGSHAFATDRDWLLAAWGDRVGAGELHTGLDWAHLIDDGPLGLRDRVLDDGFDAAAIAALLAAGPPAEPAPVTVSAAIAASGDDHELIGGGLSVDLDLGGNGSAAGWVSNPAGLRFTGLALDPGAAIVEAYFLFQAKTASTDVGGLVIELEASRAAAGFAAGPDPFAARSYLAETVAWDAPGRRAARAVLPHPRPLGAAGDAARRRRPRRRGGARVPRLRHRRPLGLFLRLPRGRAAAGDHHRRRAGPRRCRIPTWRCRSPTTSSDPPRGGAPWTPDAASLSNEERLPAGPGPR